jgi:hypothetical protein
MASITLPISTVSWGHLPGQRFRRQPPNKSVLHVEGLLSSSVGCPQRPYLLLIPAAMGMRLRGPWGSFVPAGEGPAAASALAPPRHGAASLGSPSWGIGCFV